MIPVKDNPNWFRDASGAIVNHDKNTYMAYQEKRQISAANIDRIDRLEVGFAEINNKMNQLISLLSGSKQ